MFQNEIYKSEEEVVLSKCGAKMLKYYLYKVKAILLRWEAKNKIFYPQELKFEENVEKGSVSLLLSW